MGGSILTLTALLTLSFLQPCLSSKATVIMDRLAEGKAPTLHTEDSLVFEHIRSLYLFHSRRAFDLCLFDESTLVYQGNSNSTNFTWQPLRAGHYYFSTKDGSRPSCEEGEKVPVRVINPDLVPTPPPTSGSDFLPALPSPGWASSTSSSPTPAPESTPLKPREGIPSSSSTALSPGSSGGIPFISSNPAVPLPTGETDTTTIRPLPTPGSENQMVMGLGSSSSSSNGGIQTAVLLGSVIMSSALCLWL